MGPLVHFLQQVDGALSRASPFAAVGVVVGTVYWSAVTYGAVTVMQVVGHKKGLYVMERADPLFLLMGLPAIPVVLVLGKMIHWEDYIVRLWQKLYYRGKTLCGALIFPSIASLVGRLLFRQMPSNLQRTILGGIAFVLMKGALKVYFKQQQFISQVNRQILNYPERRGDGESDDGEMDMEDSGNEYDRFINLN
ncbi:E3 ubiquitin-protein ligase MARCH5 [Takifugu flavidus]|uniref:E3 ubiquitin-protein ligase MARCH5 n=1 Tax=Takifugu flavidus TaxID=433684 RepID=A0A5C6NKJ5_9TELE|nr:E3 ubiquitin-protein ligase MARCH5 [Takifugu flavidus]